MRLIKREVDGQETVGVKMKYKIKREVDGQETVGVLP